MQNERIVNFNLTLPYNQKELPISLMLARGYTKQDIIACFSCLEKCGFGIFDHGSQGKGHFGKFIPNDKIPQEYIISFEIKKRGRPKLLIKDK